MEQIALGVLLEILIDADHSILEMTKQQLTEQFKLIQGLSHQAEVAWIYGFILEYLNSLFLFFN